MEHENPTVIADDSIRSRLSRAADHADVLVRLVRDATTENDQVRATNAILTRALQRIYNGRVCEQTIDRLSDKEMALIAKEALAKVGAA